MKRFFFLSLLVIIAVKSAFCQEDNLEYGVIVVCNTEGIRQANVNMNMVFAFPSAKRSFVSFKYYSEGNVRFDIVDANTGKSTSKTLELKRNDTLFFRLRTKGEGGNTVTDNGAHLTYSYYFWSLEEITAEKAHELENEYNLLKFNYQEDVRNPIIPNSFKSQKFTKRQGSGFLITKNKYLITNYHVVADASIVRVSGVNGNKKSLLSAKVVYSDSVLDLALLKLEDDININVPPLIMSKTNSDIGESIFVLGYPLTTTMGSDIKLTNGLISSVSGYKGDTMSYQISAPLQPGNSGGPLFNAKGDLVGVINAKHKDAENVGYAIKISVLNKFLKDSGVKDIALSTKSTLSELSLSGQVKAIQDFVYIIEAE